MSNRLEKDKELHKGQYLISKNGMWKAIFQDDGNFVIYGSNAVWASDTVGCDAYRLCMHADSNLVMYNGDGTRRWHTDTYVPMPRPPHHGHRKDCHLELTDDGKLELYRGSDIVWSSATSRGVKGN